MITKDLIRVKRFNKGRSSGTQGSVSNSVEKEQSLAAKYALPTLLLVVGVALLGIVATSPTSKPTQRVAVATTNIRAGAIVTPREVEIETVTTSLPLEGTYNSKVGITGKRLLVPIAKDEFVQQNMVAPSGSNVKHARLVVVQVPSDVVSAESVVSGELVDITGTFDTSGSPVTMVLASKVLVKGVYTPPTSIGSSPNTDIVLALYNTEEALAIIQGENSGKIGVMESTGAKAIAPGTSYPPFVPPTQTGASPAQNLPG